jgi:hypothetical protein
MSTGCVGMRASRHPRSAVSRRERGRECRLDALWMAIVWIRGRFQYSGITIVPVVASLGRRYLGSARTHCTSNAVPGTYVPPGPV